MPEQATRLAMLRNGEADIIEATLDLKPEIEKAGFKVIRNKYIGALVVYFGGLVPKDSPDYDPKVPWVGTDPLSERSIKVREAMSLAINREAIMKHLLLDEAEAMTAPNFVSGPWGDPSWKPVPYDPEKAKRLLAEAGYPNGFELTMWVTRMPGRPAIAIVAQAVAADWEKIGLEVKQEPIEYPMIVSAAIKRTTAGRTFVIGGAPFAEPFEVFQLVNRTGNPFTFGEHPELDALMDKAAGEVDTQKSYKLQWQLGDWLRRTHFIIPLANMHGIYGVSKQVGNWPMTPATCPMHFLEYVTHAW